MYDFWIRREQISFDKQLPRDNRIFYINETQNLDVTKENNETSLETPGSQSFLEKAHHIDSAKELLRMIKRGVSGPGLLPSEWSSHREINN